jgi:hypothetical protein
VLAVLLVVLAACAPPPGQMDGAVHHDSVANNLIVTRDVAKDAGQTSLLAKYRAFAAPIANRVIGSITADLTRTTNPAGESALGDVIADAQLAAAAPAGFDGAVDSFMSPGIRADLTYAGSAAGEGDGNATYGEAFTVQPFGNSFAANTPVPPGPPKPHHPGGLTRFPRSGRRPTATPPPTGERNRLIGRFLQGPVLLSIDDAIGEATTASRYPEPGW